MHLTGRRRAGAGPVPGVRVPLAAVVLVAAALRVYPWSRPNGLLGVREYDDGVYYGAARFLLEGLVPYRDVTIVHPPGISLLLLPFAAVGKALGDPVGMASARVAVLAVALVNVVLVARLAQGAGVGGRGAVAAAAVYALSPNALAAEHTVLLEPVVTLWCLLALRRLAADRPWHDRGAGLLLALGLGVKVFAAAYVLAALTWLLLRRRPRRALDLVAGLVVGIVVLFGPFLALAPAALWREVVLTQLRRPVASTANGLDRLQDMTGLSSIPMVLALALIAVLAALAARAAARDRERPLVLWLVLTLLVVAAFMAAATYFPHYGAFLTPAVAVLAAVAATRARPAGPAVLTVLLVGLAAGAWKVESRAPHEADSAAVHRAASAARCVWYESASLAVAADAFRSPTKSCPGWVDQRGELYATIGSRWAHRRDFYYAGFTSSARWQEQLVAQMEHADVLLLSRRAEDVREWAPGTRAYVLRHFRLEVASPAVRGRDLQLWRRVG